MQLLLAFAVGLLLGLYLRGRSSSASRPPAPPVRDITDHEIEELLRGGRRIDAIRRYRELHGCDVARATQMVETLEQMLRR